MTLIEYLAGLKDETELARIWCSLNCWAWPVELPLEYKPKWWDETFKVHMLINDSRARMNRKIGFNEIIMRHIELQIDDSKIQHVWNTRDFSHQA